MPTVFANVLLTNCSREKRDCLRRSKRRLTEETVSKINQSSAMKISSTHSIELSSGMSRENNTESVVSVKTGNTLSII